MCCNGRHHHHQHNEDDDDGDDGDNVIRLRPDEDHADHDGRGDDYADKHDV